MVSAVVRPDDDGSGLSARSQCEEEHAHEGGDAKHDSEGPSLSLVIHGERIMHTHSNRRAAVCRNDRNDSSVAQDATHAPPFSDHGLIPAAHRLTAVSAPSCGLSSSLVSDVEKMPAASG